MPFLQTVEHQLRANRIPARSDNASAFCVGDCTMPASAQSSTRRRSWQSGHPLYPARGFH